MSNTTIVESVKEFFETGDPIIRQWTLVNSFYQPFLSSALYIFFVKSLGPRLMQNKKPFELRNLMIVYNFFLVITYVACLSLLIYLFFTTDAYKEICAPTVVTLYTYTYYATSAGWIMYILKYIEFADTVFFVLRKKNHLITNLHVIHHAALPVICWILLRTETSGFQFIPGGLNAFVHIVMYTYYGLAAVGPGIQKYLWWKVYLTQLQMLQFVIILVFVLIIIPLSGCKTSAHGIWMDLIFATLFLSLFINFYLKTYKKKSVANGHRKHENGQANGKAKSLTTKGNSSGNGQLMETSPAEELKKRH